MKVGWTFVLNTEKPQTADKLVRRVNKFLDAEPEEPDLQKYYKGGYRYYLKTTHESFNIIRLLLDKISYSWAGVSWGCLQGSTSTGIRITGVSWVNFWISETTPIEF